MVSETTHLDALESLDSLESLSSLDSSAVLDAILEEYSEYTNIFCKQICTPEVFDEMSSGQTFEEYLKLCEERLFTVATWYEHTKGEQFPAEYEVFRGYKNLAYICTNK